MLLLNELMSGFRRQNLKSRIKPAPTLKSHKHLELSCNKKVRVVPDLIAISVPFYTIHDDLRSHSQWYYRVQETSERAKRQRRDFLSFWSHFVIYGWESHAICLTNWKIEFLLKCRCFLKIFSFCVQSLVSENMLFFYWKEINLRLLIA